MPAPWGDAPVFAVENWLDRSGVSVTSNDEDADYPAANLLEDDPSELVHWTNDDAAERIWTFDLGTARAVDVFALALVNFTEAATLTFECSSDNSAWTEVAGEFGGLIDERPNAAENRRTLIFLADATATYRYFRLRVTDTANPDGRLGAARAFLAPALQPAIADSWGREIEVGDHSTTQRTPSGVRHCRVGGRPYLVHMQFEWLTESESLEEFNEGLDRALGTTGTLILIVEPASPTKWWRCAFWCAVQEKSAVSLPGYTQHEKSYVFEEILP
jgi:hypothetical protein